MIEAKALTKRFGEKLLFRESAFRMDSPGMTALSGDSGCGKTTLARMLLGLDAEYGGQISGIPQKRACVFQEDRLLPQLNAMQNIRFVHPTVRESRIRDAFAEMHMPDDLYTPVYALSGGMKRRVSILRAVLSDADFVVMDEPLKGLDASMARTAAEWIRREMQGRTLLYITHALEEADWLQIADRLYISAGKIEQWK